MIYQPLVQNLNRWDDFALSYGIYILIILAIIIYLIIKIKRGKKKKKRNEKLRKK